MVYSRLTTRFAICALLTTAAILAFSAAVQAVPPSPEAIKQWKSQGILDQKLAEWRAADPPHTLGPNGTSLNLDKIRQEMATGVETLPETTKVLIVLVDFPDKPHTIEASRFDSLLLSNRDTDPVYNPTGSMTDFYLENSYGHFYVTGQVVGWFRMSQPYSYYWEKPDWLAREAADSATRVVNFQDFDLDGDSHFRELLVVHAGRGAEAGGDGIWSHTSQLPGSVIHDYVAVTMYTMNPELYYSSISTMGVFAHEYGHVLGMPDLYDADYEPPGSSGLGDWSLMAGGSWNGSGGNLPAHFDAYCKYQLGIVTPIVVDADPTSAPGAVQSILQAPIPQVESEPVVYYLGNDSAAIWGWWEYWLVENRQKVGFDAALPGEGLCIYHVDRGVYDNLNPLRYHVALEQADGKNSLALGGGGTDGDAGDPYPGTTNNRNFTTFTTPNSYTNDGAESRIGVWNISDSDSLMFADFETIYTHPYLMLWDTDPLQFTDTMNGGNGDGFLDPGETIEFYGYVKNVMAQSFKPIASLSVNDPSVTFIQNDMSMGISLNPTFPPQHNEEPIIFTIAPDADPANVVFTFSVYSDPAIYQNPESTFVTHFEFDGVIGKPGVLIVDDDGGQDWQQRMITSLRNVGMTYGIWDKSTLGSPTAADLLAYPSVLWHMGMSENGGTLTIPDVYAMQVFLDGGGNLFLSSMRGAETLTNIAPTFLTNYLHCALDTTNMYAESVRGIDGSEIGDSLILMYDGTGFSRMFDILQPTNGGEAAFDLMFLNFNKGVGGVSFANETYKTLFVTFPIEFIEDYPPPPNDPIDTLMARVFRTFGGIATDVADDNHTDVLPKNFALQQNYPNPFNPSTEIAYTLSPTMDGKLLRTTLNIYNVLGQRVKTLVDEVQPAGSYRVTWDGRNDTGQRVSSGVYFYRLTRGEEAATRKMVLLK